MIPANDRRSLLARLVDVSVDEVLPMLVAGGYFIFVLTSYFVLRPIRDTMGVAADMGRLPLLFVGTISAMLACQPHHGRGQRSVDSGLQGRVHDRR